MDCLTELYQVKKLTLMLENLKHGITFANELFSEWQKKNLAPEDEFTLMAQICDYRDVVKAQIPAKQLEEWEFSDYEVYTDEFHHRKYWNEIDNDRATDYFLEMFIKLMKLEESASSEFCVSLYDFSDEYVYFENEDDMNSFLCNYDCAPYTAFKIDGNTLEELYSE